MARFFYRLLMGLLLPILLLRLLFRSRRQPRYREHLRQRLGFSFPDLPTHQTPWVWVHAVSVGEMRATQPLLTALSQAQPKARFLMTMMTATGRATAESMYRQWIVEQRMILAWLPYDIAGAQRRFLAHFRPSCGLLMETEVWPNLLAEAQRIDLPVALVNARLSAKSLAGYRRFAALTEPAFSALRVISAQTNADADRLREACGAAKNIDNRNNIEVCGNLKFDIQPDAGLIAQGHAWRQAWLSGGAQTQAEEPFIVTAASTRDGEEELLLAAWLRKKAALSALKLVLVPRHPERFAAVENLLQQLKFSVVRRSAGVPEGGVQVWLGDSMGEMPAYYAIADCAFIGGSLLPLGGQNLIEAAACACPLLLGQHTFNFAQASEDALTLGAAYRVRDADDLIEQVLDLAHNKTRLRRMVDATQRFTAQYQGAAGKTIAVLQRHGLIP